MNKLIYLIAKPFADSEEEFSANLRTRFAPAALAEGVQQLQINVGDAAVAAGAKMRQTNSSAPFDGMVSFFGAADQHKKFEELLRPYVYRYAGYEVQDFERIPNTTQHAAAGERTPGFSQICTLQIPARLTREQWLDIWHGSHTAIAIETQSTFRYVQNVVQKRLNYDAPVIDAIIEECYPIGALSDPHVFYGTAGDDARLKLNSQRMLDSCVRFIDFDKIDVIITSEYIIKS